MTEAASRFSVSSVSQALLGLTIILGCGAYGAADLARSQRMTNFLLKAAPTIFWGALIADIPLVLSTQNIFILTAIALFTLSNLAGYFTKIEKHPQPESPVTRLPLVRFTKIEP